MSHPISTLRKEISNQNIKGYSRLKKEALVELMLKSPEKFKHIKMRVKPVRKPRAKGPGKAPKKPQKSGKPTGSNALKVRYGRGKDAQLAVVNKKTGGVFIDERIGEAFWLNERNEGLPARLVIGSKTYNLAATKREGGIPDYMTIAPKRKLNVRRKEKEVVLK